MINHLFNPLILPQQVLVLALRERSLPQCSITRDQIFDPLLLHELFFFLAFDQQQCVVLLLPDQLVD